MRAQLCAGLIGVVLLMHGSSIAAENENASVANTSNASSATESGIGYTGYPIIMWTPETSLMLGGGLIFYNKPNDSSLRQDEASLEAMVNFKKGFEINFEQSFYLRGNDLHFSLAFKPGRKIDRSFFGIGPDTPDTSEEKILLLQVPLALSAQYQIYKNLYLGPAIDLSSYSVKGRSADGMLIRDTVSGSSGTLAVGAGFSLLWNTTDSPFFPQTGFKTSITGLAYRKEYGSRNNFLKFQADHRHYFKIANEQILAFQVLLSLSSGDVPWEMMPALGGPAMLRGFYEGRYRDMNYAALQAEYRFPIWWRLGGAAFGGVGEVAPRIKDFGLKNMKAAGGLGLRLRLDEEEHINLRADIAVTHRGDIDFYISLLEAF